MHLSPSRPYGSVYERREGTNPARTVDTAQMLGHAQTLTNTQRNACTLTHMHSYTHTHTQTAHTVWCCLSGNEAGVGGRLVCLPLPYARGVTQPAGEMTES